MAYPNYYSPNPYQTGMQSPMDRLQQLQQPYQMPQMIPQPQPQPNQGILWVQGEAGAKSYLVAPGTSVLLMDSDDNLLYLKSADISGMPSLRTFRYTEVLPGSQQPARQPEPDLDSKYVTRKEYESLQGKYEELYKMLTPPPVGNPV